MSKTRGNPRPRRGVVTKAQAARVLGIDRATLYRWLKSGRLIRCPTGRRLAGGRAEYGVCVVQPAAAPNLAALAVQPACNGAAEAVPGRVLRIVIEVYLGVDK